MAKKTKEDNIDELDAKISVLKQKAIDLRKGNKNDKIVGDLIDDLVDDSWVKQKDKLEKL